MHKPPTIELLEAVLGFKVERFAYSSKREIEIYCPANHIYSKYDIPWKGDESDYFYTNKRHVLNIHELSNLCKLWANTIDWHIESSTSYCGDNQPYAIPVYENGCRHPHIDADTEQEAVIAVAEWINIHGVHNATSE